MWPRLRVVMEKQTKDCGFVLSVHSRDIASGKDRYGDTKI